MGPLNELPDVLSAAVLGGVILILLMFSGDKCMMASGKRFSLIKASAAYKWPRNLKQTCSHISYLHLSTSCIFIWTSLKHNTHAPLHHRLLTWVLQQGLIETVISAHALKPWHCLPVPARHMHCRPEWNTWNNRQRNSQNYNCFKFSVERLPASVSFESTNWHFFGALDIFTHSSLGNWKTTYETTNRVLHQRKNCTTLIFKEMKGNMENISPPNSSRIHSHLAPCMLFSSVVLFKLDILYLM